MNPFGFFHTWIKCIQHAYNVRRTSFICLHSCDSKLRKDQENIRIADRIIQFWQQIDFVTCRMEIWMKIICVVIVGVSFPPLQFAWMLISKRSNSLLSELNEHWQPNPQIINAFHEHLMMLFQQFDEERSNKKNANTFERIFGSQAVTKGGKF